MEVTNKDALMARRVLACVGMGVGLLSLLFGIGILLTDYPYSDSVDSYIKFGADYYTESYRAMAAAANNSAAVMEILSIVARGIGYLLIVLGLSLMMGYAIKLAITFSNETAEKPVNGQTSSAEDTSKENVKDEEAKEEAKEVNQKSPIDKAIC